MQTAGFPSPFPLHPSRTRKVKTGWLEAIGTSRPCPSLLLREKSSVKLSAWHCFHAPSSLSTRSFVHSASICLVPGCSVLEQMEIMTLVLPSLLTWDFFLFSVIGATISKPSPKRSVCRLECWQQGREERKSLKIIYLGSSCQETLELLKQESTQVREWQEI